MHEVSACSALRAVRHATRDRVARLDFVDYPKLHDMNVQINIKRTAPMIRALLASDSGPLKMPWQNAIAVGRAYELLRAGVLAHLRLVQKELGCRFCRFHAIFHDDMAVVVERPDGTDAYQWHQVDKVYDALLEMGLRPFVELNPMPKALASGEQTIFQYHMNVTPPKSYNRWKNLVRNFAIHLIDRYGLKEVRQWYFEVWNEPNLEGFWAGSQQDYWNLYDSSASALKEVDQRLRVGGPASSKASWIQDMIDHCVEGGVPLDFISTHLYPQDEYVDYRDRQGSPHATGQYFANRIREVQQTIARSARPNLEIHWTEWNPMSTDATARVSWVDNPIVDAQFGAAFIASQCIELDDACETLCYWVATDLFEEGGMPQAPFSCTYGLLTIHGIPKASFNAFTFLRKMCGNRLTVNYESPPPDGCGLCVTQDTDCVRLLVWNRRFLERDDQPTWKDQIRLPAPISDSHQIITARIRPGAGSAWETWCAMGRPQNLSATQEALLRAHAQPEFAFEHCKQYDGVVDSNFELKCGEVLYAELRPTGATAVPKGVDKVGLRRWDMAMSAKSRLDRP
jgi:xylan 1,4-beta-xylosidase